VCEEYEILNKIKSITTDNAGNMVLFCEMFESSQQGLVHVRCANHILNLVVQEGIRDHFLFECIKKLRHFCKKIHSSSKLTQYLENHTTSNFEPNLKVVLDVPTRWNSTHQMLKNALRIIKSITATSNYLVFEKQTSFSALVDEDWNLIEIFAQILEPFDQGKYLIIFLVA